jgi:hypothetical protein
MAEVDWCLLSAVRSARSNADSPWVVIPAAMAGSVAQR